MNPSKISGVPEYLSYVAGIISVLPLFFLFNARAVDKYRAFVHRIGFVERYIQKRNHPGERTSRFLPSPGIILGLLMGLLSVLAVQYVGEMLPEQFNKSLGRQSNLTKVAVLAFVLAGMLEEFWKCSLGLIACAIFAYVPTRDSVPASGAGRENGFAESSRPLFSAATPFILGAVGLGFALKENAAYINGIPWSNLVSMIFARGMASAVVHSAINFTFGLALLSARRGQLVGVVLGAYVLAVLQHGVFNFFALPQGAFPNLLTGVVLILIVFYALRRFYIVMPSMRYRALQPVSAEETPAAPPVPDEPSPGFIMLIMRDAHANFRPELQSPPFDFREMGFGGQILEILERREYRGNPPENQAEQWRYFESVVSRALGDGFDTGVWDSAAFAEAGPQAYEDLRGHGVDLTTMRPLRVLEFAPRRNTEIGGKEYLADRYVYVSCGLGPVLGRELWMSFPFSNPLVRWFLLNLATRRELHLKEFRPVHADPVRLGDPRGWYRGFLPIPLLDPARSGLKEIFKRESVPAPNGRAAMQDVFDQERWHRAYGEVPSEILYLPRPDLEFIDKYGASDYFFALKHLGYTWANDFRRPGLSVDVVRS